ncbi:MAG: type II secretion system F family protein [Candidatus Omnitrophica bacterium]|nr:type II secretion system F family protein [Candidatus Omnitrophota bacterium]
MPKFSYIARTKEATKNTGMIEAVSQDEAISLLQKKDLVVTSIIQIDKLSSAQEKKKSIALARSTTRKFKHKGASSGDLVVFARQLSMLLGAGVSLMKSLDVTLKQVDSQRLNEAISDMSKDMEAGRTFKDALAKHKNIFSELWLYLVETGEASGNLPMVLDHLANYLEEQQAFKTKIISAMMYPAILFIVAIGAVMFFVMKIVPTFTKILTSMNVALPLPTQILIGISNFLTKRFFLMILIVTGMVFLFKNLMRNENVKALIEKIQLKLPLFGSFFRFMMIESFSTTMSILIESGVPIIYALDISERSQPNKTMQEIIGGIKLSVREGKSFAIPLEKTDFFPPMVIQMISTGEEIGELSNMFKRISVYYRQYLEAFVARLTAIFEPLMIVFMGVIIGAMVISIFLPIFSLATGAG